MEERRSHHLQLWSSGPVFQHSTYKEYSMCALNRHRSFLDCLDFRGPHRRLDPDHVVQQHFHPWLGHCACRLLNGIT